MVTLVPLALLLLLLPEDALPLPAADPQAASMIAAAATAATVSQVRLAARLAERPGLSAIVSSRSP
jgi:hypothetical protein